MQSIKEFLINKNRINKIYNRVYTDEKLIWEMSNMAFKVIWNCPGDLNKDLGIIIQSEEILTKIYNMGIIDFKKLLIYDLDDLLDYFYSRDCFILFYNTDEYNDINFYEYKSDVEIFEFKILSEKELKSELSKMYREKKTKIEL